MAESSLDKEQLLRHEYHAQTARIGWHDLQPHYARGAVFVVARGCDLVDVAVQLGMDNTRQFESWIAAGQVSGVTDTQAHEWYKCNQEFWAVVAAPWVLIQASETH